MSDAPSSGEETPGKTKILTESSELNQNKPAKEPLPSQQALLKPAEKAQAKPWSRVLRHERIWTIISALAGAVAAIAALLTVYNERESQNEKREAERPYFTVSAPGIKPLPQNPPYRIQILLENIGVHPAYDLSGKILIIDTNLKTTPWYASDFSVANEVPVKTPTPWYNDEFRFPPNLPPHYVVFAIKYNDPITKKSFVQNFFMRWDGVVDGVTHPDFVHVSAVEKEKVIVKHLAPNLEWCHACPSL